MNNEFWPPNALLVCSSCGVMSQNDQPHDCVDALLKKLSNVESNHKSELDKLEKERDGVANRARQEALEYIDAWITHHDSQPRVVAFRTALNDIRVHVRAAIERLKQGKPMEATSELMQSPVPPIVQTSLFKMNLAPNDLLNTKRTAFGQPVRAHEHCHAQRDGDCDWADCPQERDKEPTRTGRHCPLDTGDEDGWCDETCARNPSMTKRE